MDSYSSFCKQIIIPAISAFTFTTAGLSPLGISSGDYNSPTSFAPIPEYHKEYKSYTDSHCAITNETVNIDNDFVDLISVKTFAEKMLEGITPIDDKIQRVIDDYFWEMI